MLKKTYTTVKFIIIETIAFIALTAVIYFSYHIILCKQCVKENVKKTIYKIETIFVP